VRGERAQKSYGAFAERILTSYVYGPLNNPLGEIGGVKATCGGS